MSNKEIEKDREGRGDWVREEEWGEVERKDTEDYSRICSLKRSIEKKKRKDIINLKLIEKVRVRVEKEKQTEKE